MPHSNGDRTPRSRRYRMRHITFAFCGLACMSTMSLADSVLNEGLPAGFDDLAVQAAVMCGQGQRPVLPPSGFSQPHDFNGDGILDYLVESSGFRCYPNGNLIWGGTAGTAHFIYVSQPGGSFTRAYASSGHALQLVDMFGNGRAMAVVIYRHGLYCGLSGVSACVGAVVWDPVTDDFSGTGYEPPA